MKTALNLAGRVTAATVHNYLAQTPPGDGFARLLVRSFVTDEIRAIIEAIQSDPELLDRVEITLPRLRYADVEGIPQALLTDRSATNLRTDDCTKEARLIVVADDGQMQSLAQIECIDPERLTEEGMAEIWILVAADQMSLPPIILEQWTAALKGLMRLGRTSFIQIAGFVAEVADLLKAGDPLPKAVGQSLNELRLPRHSTLFNDIPEQKLRQPSQWKQRLERHSRRECFIAKRDPAQVPISNATLKDKLEALRASMPDDVAKSLESYIQAKSSDANACFTPFRHDWNDIEPFFEEAQKTQGKSLGQLTHEFFEIRDQSLLTKEDTAYLDVLRKQRHRDKTKNPTDDLFYERHGQAMREDARLAGLWDRFIFGMRIECVDFLDGLAQCLQRLHLDFPEGNHRLIIAGEERDPAAFMKLNDEACCSFATQYRGITSSLAGLVEFRSVKALEYYSFRATIEDKPSRKADAPNKPARQLKFRVWIETDLGGEAPTTSAELKLTWTWDVAQVGTSLNEDLDRLVDIKNKSPLMACKAIRGRAAGRGNNTALKLDDVRCLEPLSGQKQGRFIPPTKSRQNLAEQWKKHLKEAVGGNLMAHGTDAPLLSAFTTFEQAYLAALKALQAHGWHAPEIAIQAKLFGEVIDAILTATDRPVVLESLLRPLLEIGVAQVPARYGASAIAIVCPWNPLRLAGLSARWQQFRKHVAQLLSTKKPLFTDNGSMYFGKFRQTLAGPVRPDVVAAPETEADKIFSITEFLNGYSLHGSALQDVPSDNSSTISVKAIASQIVTLASDYLRLQPHEKDNFTIALYNCDTSALAHAVIDKFRAEAEQRDEPVACQVIVCHRDEAQLRTLYRQLGSRPRDEDGFQTSASGLGFISPLRISVQHEEKSRPKEDAPPVDLVFCHDVISRAAKRGWTEVKREIRDAVDIVPEQTRRRIPVRPGEREAILMLDHPVQPQEGWSYLDALASLEEPARVRSAALGKRAIMPVRRADVRDTGLRDILNETHNMGVWVINVDDLLDRQQLIGHGIRVIKHKQSEGRDRNVVISSRNPDALLRTTLHSRLRSIDPDYSDAERDGLITRLVNDANLLSGDIVLRAAKRGNNASELLGIVLSKFLVDAELGHRAPRAWIFLDDYASWLGQSEKRIADLLCLAPRPDEGGRTVLDVIVTEAKYVSASGAGAKANDSAHQLRDTLTRLETALNPEAATVDRDIWLSRLAAMLRDGLREHIDSGMTPDDLATMLRDSLCEIRLRGYSHVFAHAAPDQATSVINQANAIPHTKSGTQEIYAPTSVRELLRAYYSNEQPDGIRQRAPAAQNLTFLPGTIEAANVEEVSVPNVSNPLPAASDRELEVAHAPTPTGVPDKGSRLRQFVVQESERARR